VTNQNSLVVFNKFEHFKISQLIDVLSGEEFRYKGRYYQRIASNLGIETKRNKDCSFNWLNITYWMNQQAVAILDKEKIKKINLKSSESARAACDEETRSNNLRIQQPLNYDV